MIQIDMRFAGIHTHASCTIGEGARMQSLHAQDTSGAKALSALIDQLRRAGMAGQPWETVGEPHLTGTVPGTGLRRPRQRQETRVLFE